MVCLNPSQDAWIGAHTTDNIAAELTALAIAQNVVLRASDQRRYCIRPDLSLSRLIATSDHYQIQPGSGQNMQSARTVDCTANPCA